MSGAPAKTGGAFGDSPSGRVVLVGRTRFDGILRLDPGIEVLRAPSPIDAIGEITDAAVGRTPPPSAGADSTPGAPLTVIVSAEADPGKNAGTFVEAVRLVDPAARIYVMDRPARGVYDGTIAPGISSEALRSLVRGVSGPAPADLVSQPVVVSTLPPVSPPRAPIAEAPAPAPSAPAVQPAPSYDDVPVLQAMLAGRDILLPLLGQVRARLGSNDVIFESGPRPSLKGAASVPIMHRGNGFGTLTSRSLPASALVAPAAWMSHWLALRDQHETLRTQAFTDDLTGTNNRRYFEQFMESTLKEAAASRLPVTLLAFDIDNFKKYNDAYGHPAGDEILKEVAKLMRSVVRPSDRVCRIGGDEFVVIFHDPSGPRGTASDGAPGATSSGGLKPSSITEIAKRFQRQICEHRFPKLAGEAPGSLTISGGLATFPWDGRTVEELLAKADELALQSKRSGKNLITLGPGAERVCGLMR